MRLLTMPRVMILLFSLCALSMVFITRCGMNMDSGTTLGGGQGGFAEAQGRLNKRELELYDMQEKEEEYRTEIQKLKDKIHVLEDALRSTRSLLDNVTQRGPTDEEVHYKKKALFFEGFMRGKVDSTEAKKGHMYNNEYEMPSFTRFTLSRLYLTDPGLGKRVVEKPIGAKKAEIYDVISTAVEKLNEGRRGAASVYSSTDFLEGIYRNALGTGTHYELFFKDLDNKGGSNYRKVTYIRPYGPLHIISNEATFTHDLTINLILPLSGRIDTFRKFMERFIRVCLKIDKRVFLTVVYFGPDGLQDVKNVLGAVMKMYKYNDVKLMTLNEPFSRGRGLQVGVQSWGGPDVLLFLCDVDIVFSPDFLERCRLNTERGKQVYYPIVFSLYNPQLVYALHERDVPPEHEQLVISKDSGFWRDFGYGMTCQYKSDFLATGGFDEERIGWGMEDVYLYRKYVKSNMKVVRSTDPGIFHLWHPKICDVALAPDQYRSCIRSKALAEGSHDQLGMLAFKDEIDMHKQNYLSHRKVAKLKTVYG